MLVVVVSLEVTGSEGVLVSVVAAVVFSGFALAESLLLDFLFFVSAFFTSSFTSSTLLSPAACTSGVDSASGSCVWAGCCSASDLATTFSS